MRVLSLGNMGSKVWIIFLAPFKDFENINSKYQIKIRKHRKILNRLVWCQYKTLTRICHNYRWFCKIISMQGGNTIKIEVSLSEALSTSRKP